MEKQKIRVKDLIATLKTFPEDTQVFIASDEEWNSLYYGFEMVTSELKKSNGDGTYDIAVLYPLSTTEFEQ